jgi:AmiR/NasT family two-component response regulator
MRAWFLQGEQGGESDALGCVLRQWISRPENSHWSVDCLRWTTDFVASVKTHQPDVLLSAELSRLGDACLTDVLAQGVGLVVATPLERAGTILPLAELYAVQMVALPASVENLGLAILGVLAAVRRQREWQARIDQLQQRLSDRILIERAKGILVERLSISEKEAYQRLRLQSRRQRRPIRDIAQCLLDAQSLFSPEVNGLVEPSNRLGQSLVDRSSEETLDDRR